MKTDYCSKDDNAIAFFTAPRNNETEPTSEAWSVLEWANLLILNFKDKRLNFGFMFYF